ncbi:hypothetical protein [Sphingomonas sp. CARO-RG-8B-R24-01]|uniref:hypothetical protein n=1 Tax=Sphingomonas sp. CARO-RG-8B-R24-01 TaxID=2914831 RepID=UPI001F5725CD|nr:hypothetical protein [Sphingomonas sp. CARO-RG-8B-R24-01]
MTRDPDLEQALVDLRPVFAALQRTEADLKKQEVRDTMSISAVVKRRARDLRADIWTRAERIVDRKIAEEPPKKFRALMALLGADARVRKRVGRRPNTSQIAKALQLSVARYDELAKEHDAAAAAAAQIAANTRERLEANRAACALFTGYFS